MNELSAGALRAFRDIAEMHEIYGDDEWVDLEDAVSIIDELDEHGLIEANVQGLYRLSEVGREFLKTLK